MVYPKANLPAAAAPWGRYIEKDVVNLQTVVATEKVNNAARDAQLLNSQKRLDTSITAVNSLAVATAQNVTDIQTITDNVFVAGTTEIDGYNIKAGTISAEAVSAGLLTGVTIATGTSGQRVEINGTNIRFLASDNTTTGESLAYYGTNPATGTASSAYSIQNIRSNGTWGGTFSSGARYWPSYVEIFARGGSAANYLNLSASQLYTSGDIVSSGYITASGHNIAGVADFVAAGSVSVPGGSGTTTSATVTFPSGRFSSTPMFVCTPDTVVPYTTVRMFGGAANGSTSATIYVNRTNTTATVFQWIAMQY